MRKRVGVFFAMFTISLGIALGVIWTASLVFRASYRRCTSGELFTYYMGEIHTIRLTDIQSEDSGDNESTSYFYLENVRNGKFYFTPYRLILTSVRLKEQEILNGETISYRIVDIYTVQKIDSEVTVALCVFCGIPELDDVVFEMLLPSESLLVLLKEKGDLDQDDQEENLKFPRGCQWTQERYEQVINSPRCKLRKEIIKHIAPGDRTKNVSGWWWNW